MREYSNTAIGSEHVKNTTLEFGSYAMLLAKKKYHRFIVEQKWACLGFFLSIITAVFISATYLADAIYFDDPRHQNVELRAWMTPRYVAHSYDLPRNVLLNILEIQPETNFTKGMDTIAENLGLTLEELTVKVKTEAEVYRELTND